MRLGIDLDNRPDGSMAREEESICALLFALNAQGGFSNTEVCRRVKEYIDSGFEQERIKSLAQRINSNTWSRAMLEVGQAQERGIKLIQLFSPDYPKRLAQLSDPPLVLFVKGLPGDRFNVAVVGTRRCSTYGRRVAKDIAAEICRLGGIVISGLAYGIDSAAHEGALTASKEQNCLSRNPGIGVLGSGVLNVHPIMQRNLAEQLIQQGGALISEYGLFTEPRKYFFPRRNRIVSGLADAVVIVEAAERSGSLITARLALEQNREVFAVPGQIDNILSRGSNRLLKEGASVYTCIDDLLATIAPEVLQRIEQQKVKQSAEQKDSPQCKIEQAGSTLNFFSVEEKELASKLLELLFRESECTFDYIVSVLQQPIAKIQAIIATLEIHGEITELPGNAYCATGSYR